MSTTINQSDSKQPTILEAIPGIVFATGVLAFLLAPMFLHPPIPLEKTQKEATQAQLKDLSGSEIGYKQSEIYLKGKTDNGIQVNAQAPVVETKSVEPVVSPVVEIPKETVKVEEKKTEVKVDTVINLKSSQTFERYFPLKKMTGKQIYNTVMANPNSSKMVKAFEQEFGFETSVKASVVLFHENDRLKTDTVGVCSPKYQINGDFTRCIYADTNSAGMDAGMKQINTFYQRIRIAKLGGVSCMPQNSRDIADSCTAKQVKWLQNLDNNILISLDIYRDSKFSLWVGAKAAGIQ